MQKGTRNRITIWKGLSMIKVYACILWQADCWAVVPKFSWSLSYPSSNPSLLNHFLIPWLLSSYPRLVVMHILSSMWLMGGKDRTCYNMIAYVPIDINCQVERRLVCLRWSPVINFISLRQAQPDCQPVMNK